MADDAPRTVVERLARELLLALTGAPVQPPLRVTDADDRLACLIQVWDARTLMPTTGAERRASPSARDGCRADVLVLMREAGGPLTRKEIVRALKGAGKLHGAGTVAKALADLTKSGELVNPKDKKGYRLGGWKKDKTPSLFD